MCGAAKKARAEAEARAAAAAAELEETRARLGGRVAALEGELKAQLADTRAAAEERLEQHTEAYRAQVCHLTKTPQHLSPVLRWHVGLMPTRLTELLLSSRDGLSSME